MKVRLKIPTDILLVSCISVFKSTLNLQPHTLKVPWKASRISPVVTCTMKTYLLVKFGDGPWSSTWEIEFSWCCGYSFVSSSGFFWYNQMPLFSKLKWFQTYSDGKGHLDCSGMGSCELAHDLRSERMVIDSTYTFLFKRQQKGKCQNKKNNRNWS